MSGDAILSARGLGLKYGRGILRRGEFWALSDVSFDVNKGETLGVIGSNGSGKSSLLRILAGIHSPDTGSVLTYGNSTSLLSLQVGFVPQLSGRENAYLSGMLLGLEKRLIKKAMGQIIEFTGLHDFIDRPIGTYSSGMRARLGFAVAFLAEPDVLLIDEVLGVGDEEFRIKSSKAMQERIRSNKTVILVSHSVHTLRSLCDRAVWLDHGRLRAIGQTESVLAQYLESVG